MFALISSAFDMVLNLVYEVLLYVFIDIVVKTFLKEARNESEKRAIWMYESAVLFSICLGMSVVHHTPYVLFVLAVSTFLYTQLVGRVNFRYWWFQLITRWDEFQQHEESMEQYNSMQQSRERLNNSQHPPPNIQVTMGPTHTQHWMPQAQTAAPPMPMPTYPVDSGARVDPPGFPQFEAWYPADHQKSQTTSTPAPTSSTPVSLHSSQGLRHRSDNQVPSPIYSQPSTFLPQTAAQPRFPPVMPRSDLARRPVHSYVLPVAAKSNAGFSALVKTKVRSAFGMPEPPSTPPGLYNPSNSNLCFVNSVLQCLANSPGIIEALSMSVQSLNNSGEEAKFYTAACELLGQLRTHPAQVDTCVLDTVALREAASQLQGSVVVPPGKTDTPQEQQDAAEFLMWTISVLHTAINVNSPQNNNQLNPQAAVHHQQGQQRFANVTLNMLNFIYADLTPQRIEQLKQDCRKEIEQANGVDNDTYAEPIQRLSDLEWLTYKDNNRSVIDDMFTGQLVEAQHCLSCNRVSVGIQAFNILPVPIVEPRQLNGLVFLEDCFTKFGNIEDLFGSDGLMCDNCSTVSTNKLAGGCDIGASPILSNGGKQIVHPPPARPRRRLVNPAGSDLPMSPIPAAAGEMFNDSGFHDNNIRTSTPIGAPMPAVRLTDGQKRSLLRQLPECLVVQLLRFTVRDGITRKVHAPVSIPLLHLDLTHLIIDHVMRREDLTALHTSFKYSLYGLCMHLGAQNTNCGHYVSYVRAVDNAWYRCDDATIQPVNMEYELNTRQVRENAYLLFYKKVV